MEGFLFYLSRSVLMLFSKGLKCGNIIYSKFLKISIPRYLIGSVAWLGDFQCQHTSLKG